MNEMKMGQTIVFKRILGIFIDLICLIAVFFGIYAIMNNTVLKSTDYKNAMNKINEVYLDSGLYTRNEANNVVLVIGDERDQALTNFYIKYEESDDTYEKEKSENGKLFEKNEDGKYTLILDENGKYDESAYDAFLTKAMKNAYYNVLIKDSNLVEPMKVYNTYSNSVFATCISVPCLVFLFVIPMILDKGQTLGKKIFKLEVTKIDGTRMGRGLFSLRFLVIAFEIVLSIFLYGLPLVIELCAILMTKNGSTIHDLICKTVVVEICQINNDNKVVSEQNGLENENNEIINAEVATENEKHDDTKIEE